MMQHLINLIFCCMKLITPVVLEGTTHYYFCVKGSDDIFDVNLGDTELIGIIKYKEGDRISFLYQEGYGLHEVKELK